MTDRGEEMVVHVSPRVQARGGIETLHRYHRQFRGRQVFVALFDREPEPRQDYHNLGISWRVPLWEMRRRFARVLARYPGALVAYHNGWGLPLFHDLDRARRRLVFLHADPAYHAPELGSFVGLIDGALAISPGQGQDWVRHFPDWDDERLVIYPVPIRSPLPRSTREETGTVILGYAGRLERGDKRLDLLPAFLAELDALEVDFRFEIIGSGSLEQWLRKELQARGDVVFHGWVDDEQYRQVQRTWDGAVYFSEHDGGPIALLEAMASGAIPFYPATGGSWADKYVPQVDPRCHYPPGELTVLARAVKAIFGLPPEVRRALREKSRRLVADHTPEQYRAICECTFARISDLPGVRVDRRRRARLADVLPLGVVTRWLPNALRAN